MSKYFRACSKSCYIDIRDFKNLEDIHSYIKNMTDIKYNKYLSSIKEFLNSEKYKYFSNEYYIKSLKKYFQYLNRYIL